MALPFTDSRPVNDRYQWLSDTHRENRHGLCPLSPGDRSEGGLASCEPSLGAYYFMYSRNELAAPDTA
ncbi:hypothetical protein ACFFX0_21130 [Citricoccus parietis]|uniref:Uncharacterized protein n=1 Tax=Citricoccus parietis TaxID=592307 RepID=A0ABV5G4J1_9MICC